MTGILRTDPQAVKTAEIAVDVGVAGRNECPDRGIDSPIEGCVWAEAEKGADREAVKTAFQRFRLETAAYFEVLQVQQQLFPAETNLAQIQLNEHLALVQLYRALGGRWTE